MFLKKGKLFPQVSQNVVLKSYLCQKFSRNNFFSGGGGGGRIDQEGLIHGRCLTCQDNQVHIKATNFYPEE